MNLNIYLGLLHKGEQTLAESFRQVSEGHGAEPDVHFLCLTLAKQCDEHEELLRPLTERFGEDSSDNEPERLHADGLSETRSGPVGLLRDLQDVYILASLVDVTWTVVEQAGSALRDRELLAAVEKCQQETQQQISWLKTRMKQAAPQALLVTG